MSRDLLRKLDEKEEKRTDALFEEIQHGKTVADEGIFDSDMVLDFLKQKPLSLAQGFVKDTTVMNSVLFSKILIMICPMCECVLEPELIRPFLERELVLPILNPLAQYREDFANLMLKYPYISGQTWNLVKHTHMLKTQQPYLCGHCLSRRFQGFGRKVREAHLNDHKKRFLRLGLRKVALPSFIPTFDEEQNIVNEISHAVNNNKWSLLEALIRKASMFGRFRDSTIFGAIPQVDQNDLSRIARVLHSSELTMDPKLVDKFQDERWIMKALKLDYNPSMPVEDYLDIMLPRRRKVNSILKQMLSTEGGRGQLRKSLSDEIWKVNREIAASKKLESFTFVTDFASNNAGIIFLGLIGGLIGYASGSLGACSVGGIAGGITGGAVRAVGSKLTGSKPFRPTTVPKKTKEWLEEKIEGPEERLLSKALAKDIKVIQVYRLQKKLKRI